MKLISSVTSEHQKLAAEAIKKGLDKYNISSQIIYSAHQVCDTKTVSCWGWRIGKDLRESGKNVLVVERAYVGDRFKYFSIGWNGLNGYADFGNVKINEERYNNNFAHLVKKWNENGDYVLICMQVPNDASLKGQDMTSFYQDIAEKAAEFYGLPVFYRLHPDAVKKGYKQGIKGFQELKGDFEESVLNAKVVIAYNSNSTLEAARLGKPSVIFDSGAMSKNISSFGFSNDFSETKNRIEEIKRICSLQFTLEEIEEGMFVESLIRGSDYVS